MKAFLLAGGRGERLRPLALDMPKCMVPIRGRPLLAIWLDLCARAGIDSVLLNVSQHPDHVDRFLRSRIGLPRVTFVPEGEPRGTAGTVTANRDFVAGEESFWILYSDNLTDVSLADMAATHRRHGTLMTMGLFRAPVPEAAGIVKMDDTGLIVGFEEKPAQPKGDLANAGLYLARAALLDEIPVGPPIVDFGHDVLPALVGRMHGHVVEGFIRDIGTPAALAAATSAWDRRVEGRES